MTKPFSLPICKYNQWTRTLLLAPPTGYSEDHHAHVLLHMEAALASRTWRNKAVEARRYMCDMTQHQGDPHAPSQYHIISYLMELSDELKYPYYHYELPQWGQNLGHDL